MQGTLTYLSPGVFAYNRSPAYGPAVSSDGAEINKIGGDRTRAEREEAGATIHNFSNNRTITSFRSLVCRWCSGSRKFCLMLSSNEYFTSAICFMASPISMRAWAARIDQNGVEDKVTLRQYDLDNAFLF